MILSVTGHRPAKIGGYDPRNPLRVWIVGRIRQELQRLRPTHTISGMALGVDQDFGWLCVELQICRRLAQADPQNRSRRPYETSSVLLPQTRRQTLCRVRIR